MQKDLGVSYGPGPDGNKFDILMQVGLAEGVVVWLRLWVKVMNARCVLARFLRTVHMNIPWKYTLSPIIMEVENYPK